MNRSRILWGKVAKHLSGILLFIGIILTTITSGTWVTVFCAASCLFCFVICFKRSLPIARLSSLITPFLLCFFVGTLSAAFNTSISFHEQTRASFYLLQNIVMLCFGFFLASIDKNGSALKGLFFGGLVVCFIHFFLLAKLFASGIAPSFGRIRTIFIYGDIPVVIAFFLLLVDIKNFSKYSGLKKIGYCLSFLVFGLNIGLELSRSNIVLELALLVFFAVKIFPRKKAFFLIGITAFSFFALFLILYLLKIPAFVAFFEKLMNSLPELSPNHDWSDNANRNLYWRGYEIFSGLTDFSSYSFWSKLTGKGLGYSIPLPYAHSLGSIFYSSLPVIHNSFVDLLCCCGVFGLLLILLFFFRCFKFSLLNFNFLSKAISFSLILFFFSVSYTTMAIFDSAGFASVLFLFSFFAFWKGESFSDKIFYREKI